ncbi:MAG: septum formation initiator family protein [Acidobacteriaceae bacterium]|nr:septum formation initiator family protein [Acidobacteriaceae bacterium]MBV9781153.1 septum formation initiator family protein [Acidobacteriaceae bacterium]
MLRCILRPVAAVAALVGLAAYAAIMLRGPQGLAALTEKRRQLRALEEENATLRRNIEAKKQRIERLKRDPKTQELEIRKRLKLQREGETSFVLPDQPNAPAASEHSASGVEPK